MPDDIFLRCKTCSVTQIIISFFFYFCMTGFLLTLPCLGITGRRISLDFLSSIRSWPSTWTEPTTNNKLDGKMKEFSILAEMEPAWIGDWRIVNLSIVIYHANKFYFFKIYM